MSAIISSINHIYYETCPVEREVKRSLIASLLTCLIPSFLGEELIRDLLSAKRQMPVCHRAFESLWHHPVERLSANLLMENWAPISCQEGCLLKGFSQMRETYSAHPLRLKTPDGIELTGTLFQNTQTEQRDIPTVIYYCGYGENYRTSSNIGLLLESAMRAGKMINLVAFDYRDCLESQRAPLDSQAIVLDGLSLYRFAKEGWDISEENICLYGFSLGGGVAHAVRQQLGDEFRGKMISDRSFSTYKKAVQCAIKFAFQRFPAIEREVLFKYIQDFFVYSALTYIVYSVVLACQCIFAVAELIRLPIASALGYIFSQLGALHVDLYNWNLDSTTNWFENHKIMVIEHEDDPVIQPLARISRAMTLAQESHLKVRLAEGLNPKQINSHCTPFTYHVTEQGGNPMDEILNFIHT